MYCTDYSMTELETFDLTPVLYVSGTWNRRKRMSETNQLILSDDTFEWIPYTYIDLHIIFKWSLKKIGIIQF